MFYSQIFKPCPVLALTPLLPLTCMQKPSQDITGPAPGPGLVRPLSSYLWNRFRNSRMTLGSAPSLVTTLLLLLLLLPLLDRWDCKSSSRFPRNPREGKDWEIWGKIPMPQCDPSDCNGWTGFYNFWCYIEYLHSSNNTKTDLTTDSWLPSHLIQIYQLGEASQ